MLIQFISLINHAHIALLFLLANYYLVENYLNNEHVESHKEIKKCVNSS